MYWILDSLSVELGFGFQPLVGLGIPCAVIPDSKAQDSGFIAKTCWTPDSKTRSDRSVLTNDKRP